MVLRTVIATGIACAWATLAPARDANMSFFITSKDPGQGANLGGLADADAYCTRLAEAAGITGKVWAAYLSTSAENARPHWHLAGQCLYRLDQQRQGHRDGGPS